MTYLAQFYEIFSKPPAPPLARDSGLSSFKNSSTEEEVVRRVEGTVSSVLELRRSRPVSWHCRVLQSDPLERENPFRDERSEDADDEMGEVVVVRLRTREDLAVRRRRPSSLSGVLPASTESPARLRQDRRRRESVRREEKTLKRKLGGQTCLGYSDLPRPYQSTQPEVATVKRRRSEDLVTEDNINNETVMRLRESRDQIVERVVQVRSGNLRIFSVIKLLRYLQAPLNIAERQKLLKTKFLQVRSPQCNKDRLKLDIFQIKYQKLMKQSSPPKSNLCLGSFPSISII